MEKGIVDVFEIMHGIGDWGVCVLVAELFEGCSICFQHLVCGTDGWDCWEDRYYIDGMDMNQILIG